MAPLSIVLGLLVFVAGSLVYVYRYRGQVRFGSVKEYLRKGWPIFAPLNCLLYLFTRRRVRKAIADLSEFPELGPLRANWETIRDEAEALYRQGYFEKTNSRDSKAYYDLGFRTFYKYGWSKFYLKWYGYTHASARELCPKTAEILRGVRSVNGAMFSLLPVGSQLTRHLDPVACSMRYHLGLLTPNDDACFIEIDGVKYSWRDGEALLFDETYLHHAKNGSSRYRLILMCDVERPMWLPGRLVNLVYKGLMRLTVVPNLDIDKRGLTNRIFSTVTPMLDRAKALKQTNRGRYRLIKYTVNSTLAVVVVVLASGIVYAGYHLAAGVID